MEGLKRAKKLGITAMEIEWVQNVPKDPARMAEIRKTAEELDITLTVHAPYYVNLNSPDETTLSESKKRIIAALSMGELAGVRSVCVHAAFNLKQSPEVVYANVSAAVEDILQHKAKLFPHVNLGIETMGKAAQFGTLEECLKMSKEYAQYPVLDPAHMHARFAGAWNTAAEWNDMFDQYQRVLGKKALKNVHMHYSGIEYGPHGEKRHLPLRQSDANWKDFLRVLKEREIEGTVVCESPLLEEDTLLLQREFATI